MAGQAAAAPRRRRSAAYTPRTKPTKSPTTGTTKKPTKASAPPNNSVERGTPASFSRRPGSAYFTTAPMTRKVAATANTIQAVEVPTSVAQTRIAPRMRIVPGSTGTTMPAMPTAIRIAITTSVRVTRGSLPQRGPPPPGGGRLAGEWQWTWK